MTSVANPWQVQVLGEDRDLEYLARHLTALPRAFRRDEGGPGFIYESCAFALCKTSEEVLETADSEFAVFSGVLSLVQGSSKHLESGGVYRRNTAGSRDAYLRVHDVVHAQYVDEVELSVMDADGNAITISSPPSRTERLADLAFSDGAVAKALRLMARPDYKSWVGLYRLYELIEADVGGRNALTEYGWSTVRAIERFKHSANSIAVAGDAARHGRETGLPPKQPMALDEAHAYITYVVEAWLACKRI